MNTIIRNYFGKWRCGVIVLAFCSHSSAQSDIVRSVTASQLEMFCGTKEVKIAFTVGDSALFYVDFSEGESPAIHKMRNVEYAAVPAISPDGQWIAFATGTAEDAATRKASTAWAARLREDAVPVMVSGKDAGYVPRFVQSETGPPRVLFATCGSSGSGYAWESCGAMVSRSLGDGNVGAPRVVHDGGSWFGGLSYDNRYLVTAENSRNAYILDLHAGGTTPAVIHALPVTNSRTHADSVINLQACNPSVSASRKFTDAIMYLDMGAPATLGGEYVAGALGSGWGFHTRLFIARYDGCIYRYFDCPSGPAVPATTIRDSAHKYNGWPAFAGSFTPYEWRHPEWTNHPYYAAVIVTKNRKWYDTTLQPLPWANVSRGEELQLLNVKDGGVLTVLEIADTARGNACSMKFVSAWIKVDGSFVEDQAWLEKPDYKTHRLSRPGGSMHPVDGNGNGAMRVFNIKGRLLRETRPSRHWNGAASRGLVIVKYRDRVEKRIAAY
ncbi:MAG: hypothetical protein GF350_07785 [Chitinivibrionales bacterium]|nr:hypothetical protein [Chitinivibrionales bacterium]